MRSYFWKKLTFYAQYFLSFKVSDHVIKSCNNFYETTRFYRSQNYL